MRAVGDRRQGQGEEKTRWKGAVTLVSLSGVEGGGERKEQQCCLVNFGGLLCGFSGNF